MSLKKMAVVLNGFLHDFATGYWLAVLICIGMLHRFQGEFPSLAGQLGVMERCFFWQSVAAAVVIMATGGVRSFTYVDNFYGADAERTRRRMLVIKHLLLFVLFGIGSWVGWRMAFHP